MTAILTNNNIAETLFMEMLGALPDKASLPRLIIVQHIVPNTIPLLKALNAKFDIACIIPKPNSIHGGTLSFFHNIGMNVLHVQRPELDRIHDTNHSLPIKDDERPFLILDIGGYFAGCVEVINQCHNGRLVGIVEDTENGHQKYERLLSKVGTTPYPIYSVARSPLKEPEDFLVGQSIVFSVESIVRDNYSLILNRQVLVIGYGKIGRSIASSLAVRNINVWVYDNDPIKQAQAMSHGFLVPERDFAIANAGLIFGATGNKSLTASDLNNIKNTAFIASVTSHDDEFDFSGGTDAFRVTPDEQRRVFQYLNPVTGKVFYFINNGDAVNFVHNNALGVYIYLVACEIIACLKSTLAVGSRANHSGIYELDIDKRRDIAANWKSKFFGKVLG